MAKKPLDWPRFKTVGGQSEVAVLAPIRLGRPVGERRSYAERLRDFIDSVQQRADAGVPTALNRVDSIHFGRIIIIRPEHYLTYSLPEGGGETVRYPELFADYEETAGGETTGNLNHREHRSWILTLVEFDGDPRIYFRDIAELVGEDFDQIFMNCEDYPGVVDQEKFWAWIRRYQIEASLFYPVYADLSVVEIKELQRFRREFDAFVARVRGPDGYRVRDIEDLFDDFLRQTEQRASGFPSPGGVFGGG